MTAIHIDETAKFQEEAAFLGQDDAQIYTCLHAPLQTPAGALVMCSSAHAELQENYRSEVLLARLLATRGLAALRFHYRGFGHSDGDGSDATFQSMRADTLAAIEQVQAATGAARVALLGVRLGALIAASAAHELDDAPLVLWQPVADPARYFRDATRARRVHRLRSDASGGSSGGSLAEELGRGEPADVLGYPLHRALYETLARRTLAQELGPRPRPILLVQMSPRPQLDPEHARLVEALERSGAPVDVKLVSAEPAWWFARGVTRTPPAVSRAIADWVVARLGGEQP